MKDFEPSGFFVLRTPLLPFEEFLSWTDGLEAAGADEGSLEPALARDREVLRERLRTAVARPEVRDALFVASPSLEGSIDSWISEPDSKRGRAVERALVRYLSRMSTRPTPFGLFAGCSVGTVGGETRLELGARDEYRRHSRLDMDYLDPLARALARDPSIRQALTYRPNSSLYRAAGRVRYVESRLDGKDRSHHLVAVEDTETLRAVLERAADGATPSELADAVAGEDVSGEDADAYVEELIDAQIVVPDLAVPVTGLPPVEGLLEQVERYPEAGPAAAALGEARAELDRIDAAGVGAAPERYRDLAASLEALPAEIELHRLFQVDLVKPAPDSTLGQAVIEEVSRAVRLLGRLASSSRGEELRAFRQAFAVRYEQQQEVPLLEALDEEVGVGFGPSGIGGGDPAPLLAGMDFPAVPDPTVELGPHHELLVRLVVEAAQTRSLEVVVDRSELEEVAGEESPPLPPAFAVIATVAASSEEALGRGDFLVYVEGYDGPSGARMLGRFCHADDVLRKHVEDHLRAEEALDPEAVFAEVVHLPEGRIGNILSRPVMREHEIPYLGRSGAPPDRQIPAADLLVSVAGESIVLRSRRLGRRVIPRLTSAHNFTWKGIGVYRFLGLLQADGPGRGTAWGWGSLESSPFLPRVRMGRVVLSPARWRVDKREIRRLTSARDADRFRAVRDWRAERELPRRFVLADYDNRLMVDLDNVLSVESFVHLLKRRDEATIQEIFPGPDDLVARGPEGRFAHELLIPFVRSAPAVVKADARRAAGRAEPVARPAFQRTLPPGSEWLYAKLYMGTATADRVLLDVVEPLARELVASGVVDRWFFIRYGDDGDHVRVRFHGEPDRLLATVLPALRDAWVPLVESGMARRFQLDTYEREVERYGGPEGMELGERVFHADSEAVLEILGMLEEGDAGADERWRLALCGSAMLLSDLGLTLERKLALATRLRDEFAKEFRSDAGLKRQVADRFRKERASLEVLHDPPEDDDHPLGPGFEVYRRRSERLAPLFADVRALDEAGTLSSSIEDLAASYVHMHVNRMLRSGQRPHEMVLYDFLARLFRSKRERASEVGGRNRAGDARH